MESIKNNDYKNTNINETYIKFLNSIFQECPDGFVFRDEELYYRGLNKAFCKHFKIENKDSILGQGDAHFLSSEQQILVKKVNETVKKELKAVSYIIDASDNILSIITSPIIYNDKFCGIISLIKDITYEENIKEKFVIKHSQIKSLLENIPMLIYLQDNNFNYITGTKPSKIFVTEGYDALSDIHINHEKLKILDDIENKYVLENNKTLIKEKEVEDYNSIQHWYKIYKVPINDFTNKVTGIITLINNMDSEKQLQAQRETFVASVGHDLKNPTIAQIRGLELLLKGDFGEIKSEQKELLQMVLDSCKYMKGMLSSLLETYRNYGGVIKLNFEDFSLLNLIEECVSEMTYVAKDKDIMILVNKDIKNDIVNADRVQIKRVIMNLLSNGIKYAYKETILNLFLYTEKDKVCFKFENNSPFIPEDKQKGLFAQYVSYASTHKELGIGLGLYASKKIIEGHNGNIFVKSYKENKNTFGFKIPQKQSHASYKEICF